jgi:hypothetical protein
MGNLFDGVQIHGYVSAFNKMHLSLSILARPAPTLAWIRLVFELQGWDIKARMVSCLCEVDHREGMDWEGLDYGP